MKILLMATLTLGSISSSIAEMRFNPLNNRYYSYPETPDISQHEYVMLLIDCATIKKRIIAANGEIEPDFQLIIDQYIVYLTAVGTPTALRLIADLKRNAIFLSNGTFLRKFWY